MSKKLQNPAKFLPPTRLSKNVDCSWTASSISSMPGPGQLYNLREHGSSTGQLIYSSKGRGFFRSAEKKWVLAEAGDLFYYAPKAYQEYGDLLNSRWEYHWIHFIPKPHWKSWLQFSVPTGIPGLAKASFKSKRDQTEVLSLLDDVHQHLRYGGPWRIERALNLVEAILLLANQASAQKLPDDRIRAVLESIAENPFQNFRVETLAMKAGLSPSRFAHLFKKETGLSVLQCLLQTKLHEARNLLANSSKSISEIASLLGLSSGEYLSFLFKRHFGVSPSKFRSKDR